jgi:pantoate--beta-alanine ligase
MKVYKQLAEWREVRRVEVSATARVGFVPTMGALHAGHASLLERARRECDIVVLSVFVNPTQFDNKEDLQKYPMTLEADLEIARALNTDYVILPDFAQIYPDGYRYKIIESQFSRELCGAHRPGHFDGVLTVVMKLFNLVRPHRAYFGEKDFQQLQLIKGMVDAFFMDQELEIVPCATMREPDSLAMSSRNTRLSPEARARARVFPEILMAKLSLDETRKRLDAAGFEVDYIEDHGDRRFGAVRIDGVRLIDNVEK